MRKQCGSTIIGAMVLALALSACSPSLIVPEPTPAPEQSSTTAVDAAAQQKVDTWLETAPMPPEAVRSAEQPADATFHSYQGWTCSPMATATAYWTVDGISIVDASNWLLGHPVPGLMPTWTTPYEPRDEQSDAVTFGNIPELGSQEGIAFSVVKRPGGIAIRAEAGVIPESAVCQTPAPGESFGSPGEG